MKPEHHGRQIGNARGRFELPGHRSSHGQPAVKQTIYICPIMPRNAGYTFNGKPGIPDDLGDIYTHGRKSVVSLQNCQGSDGAKSVVGAHNSDMPRWKYRDAFDADYRASKLSREEIAKVLGRSPHTVDSYRRKGDTCVIPKEDVIRKAAKLFGHNDPFRYMDDPQVAEGVGLASYADMPQWKKDLLQRQARTLDGSTLTPQQWEMLFDSLAAQARSIESATQAGKKDVTK